MIIPVVWRIERNRHKADAIPLGRADQAPPRLFGKAGFDADAVRIQTEQAVMVSIVDRLLRVDELDGHLLLRDDPRKPAVVHRLDPQKRHVVRSGIVLIRIQARGCNEVGILHADFLRTGIHQLRKFCHIAGHGNRRGVGGIVARNHHHSHGQIAQTKLVPGHQPHGGTFHPNHLIRNGYDRVLDFGLLQREQGRHDFCCAGHGQLQGFLLGKQNLAAVRIDQYCRFGRNLRRAGFRLFLRRYRREQRDHQN